MTTPIPSQRTRQEVAPKTAIGDFCHLASRSCVTVRISATGRTTS